jgi:hypothetical protein
MSTTTTDRCHTCMIAGTKFNICGACRNVRYCSRECQVKSWKEGHKEACTKKMPKSKVKLVPNTTQDGERADIREMIRAMHKKNVGNKMHCTICGDTENLRRLKLGVLCTDCIDIQARMR